MNLNIKPKEKLNKEKQKLHIMHHTYNNKGITLIALIITVVILLILAVVAINAVQGDGIITGATTAKEKTQEGNVKEQVRLDILEEQMKNEGGNISAEKLKEILEKYFDGVPEASELETKLKETGFKLKSKKKYGGQEIELGDIYSGGFEKDIVTAEQLDNELKEVTKVQYVTNYGIDIDGDKNAEDDWEIFYIEDYKGEDGAKDGNQPTIGKRIFLIASDYVRKDTEELQKAVGSDKANMNSVSGDWEKYCKRWSSVPTYDCTLPNDEGDEKACTFPKLFEFSNYDIKAHISNPNSKCASSLLCTENWSSFVKSEYADYATGGPSVEMWINSWNKRHPGNEVYYSSNNSLGYCVGLDKNPTSGSPKLSNIDPLYFPRKEQIADFDGDGSVERCDGYWLASPGFGSNGNLMSVNWQGYLGTTRFDSSGGIRPIVCLKADVKLVKSSITLEKDGIEAECYEIAK